AVCEDATIPCVNPASVSTYTAPGHRVGGHDPYSRKEHPMNPSRWLSAAAAAAVAVPVVLVASASPGAAQDPTWTAQALTPTERIDVIKAPTSRLAQTDESLLGLTSSDPIPVVVKLDHDPLATYAGEVSGYAATSPAVTGEPLSNDAAERRYESYLAQREASFAA